MMELEFILQLFSCAVSLVLQLHLVPYLSIGRSCHCSMVSNIAPKESSYDADVSDLMVQNLAMEFMLLCLELRTLPSMATMSHQTSEKPPALC